MELRLRLLSAVVPLFLAPQAWAEDTPSVRLGLDIRFDLEMSQSAWEKADNGRDKTINERFVLTSGRFNLWGRIDEKTSYRIRYEMKGNHTDAGADNITSAINYFYLDHAFSDRVYLRVGKQFVVTSSWEFNYNRSQVYHYSETFLRVPAHYETGAQVGVKLAGQTMGVQATNSIPEAADKKGQDFTKGIFWYGNIADSLLQPIVSYVVFPRAPMSVAGEKDDRVATTVLSLGTKANLKPFDFDLYGGQLTTPTYDYYTADSQGGAAVRNTAAKESWTAVIAYARYKMENPMLHPFVKISHDTGKIDNTPYFSFLRYSLGAEWFPTSERFWLHAAYVGHRDRFLEVKDGSTIVQPEDVLKVSKILAGVGSSF